MDRFRRTVVVLALVALVAACGDDDPTSGGVTGDAHVDHLDFVTGVASDVRFRVNGVLRAELGYTEGLFDDLIPLGPATSLRFRAEDTSGAAINDRDVVLHDGGNYATYLLGDRGSLGYRAPYLLVTEKEYTPPAPGKARVRFLHAMVDADNVDVLVGGGTAWDTIGYREITGFLEFDASVDTVVVRDLDGVIATLGGGPLFTAGRVHRLVLHHAAADRKTPGMLTVYVHDDPPTP